MAKFYSEITPELQAFIADQKLFFTATAPTAGLINLSPKGMDTFRCFDAKTVGYLDVTGSGNETSAHLIENGRMTIMFCSFVGAPLILRLYGQGRVVRSRDANWEAIHAQFQSLPGERQIIILNVDSVQTSCGFGVPLFDYQGDRTLLVDWAEKKGPDGLYEYWKAKNQQSIDQIPTYLLSEPPSD
ncbi:MAG: pyridoxamine 5'-phosphate oxidase family protein [Oscillatoriales cyanobacterium]|nr:MAG: pyridoxamine 5'-phosphate oxidase family protein [Oscillatoriales cyanobacterium]